MKKGRPGLKLSVLAAPEKLRAVNDFLLENTSTIGLRYYPVDRTILPRKILEVDTPYGQVLIKEVTTPSGRKRRKIEHESIIALSKAHGISVQQLQVELYQWMAEIR